MSDNEKKKLIEQATLDETTTLKNQLSVIEKKAKVLDKNMAEILLGIASSFRILDEAIGKCPSWCPPVGGRSCPPVLIPPCTKNCGCYDPATSSISSAKGCRELYERIKNVYLEEMSGIIQALEATPSIQQIQVDTQSKQALQVDPKAKVDTKFK